jgi:hypothetical protein
MASVRQATRALFVKTRSAKDCSIAAQKQGYLFPSTMAGIWQPLQLNLPHTPIHDMVLHERDDDLILATHGRSFWILDDISPLRQMAEVKADADITLSIRRAQVIVSKVAHGHRLKCKPARMHPMA